MKTKDQKIKNLITLYVNIKLSMKYRGYSRQQRSYLDRIEQEYIVLTGGQFINDNPEVNEQLISKQRVIDLTD